MNEAQEAIFIEMQDTWSGMSEFRSDCERLIAAGTIVVDIGEAVKALEESPELCETMGRLLNEQPLLNHADAHRLAELITNYTDNNLSMFDACDMPSDKAKELYEAAKTLRDMLAPVVAS